MDKMTPLFTITGSAKGGRNGHSETNDGRLKVDLSVPKLMGGPGKADTVTPEHLFAAGYAACFAGALDFVAKQNQKNAEDAYVDCSVSIGKRNEGGFAIAVKMKIKVSTVPQKELEELVKEAHEKICPYSHAIRNNVQVDFEVVGA